MRVKYFQKYFLSRKINKLSQKDSPHASVEKIIAGQGITANRRRQGDWEMAAWSN
jgi:hypothetical protein